MFPSSSTSQGRPPERRLLGLGAALGLLERKGQPRARRKRDMPSSYTGLFEKTREKIAKLDSMSKKAKRAFALIWGKFAPGLAIKLIIPEILE
jgi:hypothetical protein